MKFKNIVGLFIVLIGCSYARQTSISRLPTDSGLLIENEKNRGVGYTDSLGAKYNLRYIPITITNDSTIPILFQITFSKEYDYPIAYGDEQFKVFPFPKEFNPDEVTWDSISYELGNNALRDFLDRGLDTPYLLSETLEPGEIFVMAIGTLYPRPPKVCGVLPNTLFAYRNSGIISECDWLMEEDSSSIPIAIGTEIALVLKLTFRESCTIIPCGQIFYPNN